MAEYEIKDGVGIIPEGTTKISFGAFEGCSELRSVVIPDSACRKEIQEMRPLYYGTEIYSDRH